MFCIAASEVMFRRLMMLADGHRVRAAGKVTATRGRMKQIGWTAKDRRQCFLAVRLLVGIASLRPSV